MSMHPQIQCDHPGCGEVIGVHWRLATGDDFVNAVLAEAYGHGWTHKPDSAYDDSDFCPKHRPEDK